MTDALKITDDESAAVAVAPRVTLESMKAKIESVHYYEHGILTMCVLTMQNGFFVLGESAPASPENYDKELGRKFAYENAIRDLWKLEGYALREKLSRGGSGE